MNEKKFQHVEGKYVRIKDLKMYYEEYGYGYPLILIHGGASSIQMWDHQIPDFSSFFKVIAVDCRGQGKTNNPSGEFHYKQMADDFANLIKKLELEKVLICGWSDGAQIALEMGLLYPELAKALIVGGALLDVSQEMIEGMKAIGTEGPGKINYEHLEKSLPCFVKLLKEHHSFVYGEEYWKEMLANITKMWLDPKEFLRDKVKKIPTPSLILQGDRDDYIPISDAIKMHELMPKTELAIIPNANHDVYETSTEIFNKITLGFLLRQTKDDE